MTPYVCIAVPYFLGVAQPERTELAALYASGIASALNAPWVDVVPEFHSSLSPVVAVNRALSDVIAAHSDRVPLVFGQDCVNSLGVMAGLQQRALDPEVLWYDAHGDFNTPETTVTGFLGGMPLAALVGRGNQDIVESIGLDAISESLVTLTDARNLDAAEAEALANSGIAHLRHLRDVHQIEWGDEPFYVHIDLDVVDATEMPAVTHPEPKGASVVQLIDSLLHVRDNARIVAVSFTLWKGDLPGADRCLANLLRILRALAL
ncbi:MAG: arginase family protein [Chloroflexota bacterium]|nr:arginase family protein [Chloroflexota bacterium]